MESMSLTLCIMLKYMWIYILYEIEPIIHVTIKGLIKNLFKLSFKSIVLLKSTKHIQHITILEIIDEYIAPLTLNIDIKTIFNINLIILPIANAITGMFTFPNPCRAPFIVCVNTTNTIVNDDILSISPPIDAFGKSNPKNSFENKYISIVNGIPINIVTSIENRIFFFATSISFFATAPEIAGTSAVANAILNENGSITNVSTLPFKIPYCSNAFSSPIILFSILTTVSASMVFVVAENKAHKLIGIDTSNILFMILIVLSLLYVFDDMFSCHIYFLVFTKFLYK